MSLDFFLFLLNCVKELKDKMTLNKKSILKNKFFEIKNKWVFALLSILISYHFAQNTLNFLIVD